jgi:uncharacterized RDD family membrane protein YckC
VNELVTGEAVALELRPARLPSRALAVLIDLTVAMLAYIAVSVGLLLATASLDEAAQIAVSIAAFLLVLVGGPIVVETLSHGRSLGKLACGLRVVRDDGGPIRFRHALVRGAVGVVEILATFGVVACIASLVSERGRRLGDVFAGTLVVRERVPTGRAHFPPPPPPWLAGQFAGVDLSAVPDGLWLATRQYLTRMHQLDPRVGWAMAERLSADLTAYTGVPAPQGVPPAAFLAALLQERQAREARRAYGAPVAGGVAPASATAPSPYSTTRAWEAPASAAPAPTPPASTLPQPSAPLPADARPVWASPTASGLDGPSAAEPVTEASDSSGGTGNSSGASRSGSVDGSEASGTSGSGRGSGTSTGFVPPA